MKHDFKALSEIADRNNVTLSLALYYADVHKREFVDFGDAIFDSSLEGIVEFFEENGIDEFTVSSGYSGTVNAIVYFCKHGFKMTGVVEIPNGTKWTVDGEKPDTKEALKFERI